MLVADDRVSVTPICGDPSRSSIASECCTRALPGIDLHGWVLHGAVCTTRTPAADEQDQPITQRTGRVHQGAVFQGQASDAAALHPRSVARRQN